MEINKLKIKDFEVYHILSSKFKTFTIGIYFLSPLVEKELAYKSILSNYLTKYNEFHQSEKDLSIYLKKLYGMNLFCSYGRTGLVTSMNFVVRSINDKFLSEDEHLLDKAVEILNDTINHPFFDETLIDLEKKLLIEDIKRLYDNKSQYATKRFIDLMMPNEKCHFSSIGTIEAVEQIDLDNLLKSYQKMLSNQKIIYVIGDFKEQEIANAFERLEVMPSVSETLDFIDYETKEISKVNEVIEEQKNRQSIVLMGYRSEIRVKDKLYEPMLVLSGMLGGFFHSTLFQEIREKRSLAYSINCDYNPRKGNFAIFAGISASKYDEFKEVVGKIIDDYKNGLFEDDVITLTKKSIITSIYKTADQQTYGVQFIINELAGIKARTIEEKVESINAVTKDELIEAAKCLKLDTIYLLKGTL